MFLLSDPRDIHTCDFQFQRKIQTRFGTTLALNVSCRTDINSSVKPFRTVLTLLMVALWPLVVSHCDLEQLPGFEFLACGDGAAQTPHQDNECETDSCASVESGLYKTESGRLEVPTPSVTVSPLLTASLLEATRLDSASNVTFDSAPPEIPTAWRFLLRTALPPRAPSFVS